MLQKGINFNDMPTEFKRGVCCRKQKCTDITINFATKEETRIERNYWVLDIDIPIFTQHRDYVERTFMEN